MALNLNFMFYICLTHTHTQMMIFPHEDAGVPEHVGVSSSGDSIQQAAASMWRLGGGVVVTEEIISSSISHFNSNARNEVMLRRVDSLCVHTVHGFICTAGCVFSEPLLGETRQQIAICQFYFKPSNYSSRHTSVCPTRCRASAASISPAGVSV